jgi:periplasmic protein TonB
MKNTAATIFLLLFCITGLAQVKPGKTKPKRASKPITTTTPTATSTTSTTAATGSVAEEKPQEEAYTIVEEMPQFPGGREALAKYLSTSIQYPAKEKEAKIEGKVFVSFIVEKDGAISNVRVMKGVPGGPGLDAEAVRVISSMPKWTAGKQSGRTVRVNMNQPIKFSLQ